MFVARKKVLAAAEEALLSPKLHKVTRQHRKSGGKKRQRQHSRSKSRGHTRALVAVFVLRARECAGAEGALVATIGRLDSDGRPRVAVAGVERKNGLHETRER